MTETPATQTAMAQNLGTALWKYYLRGGGDREVEEVLSTFLY